MVFTKARLRTHLSSLWGLFRTLGLVVCCATPCAAASDPSPPAPTSGVRIDIIEKIPDEPKWSENTPDPAESFAEAAFGFVAMPTRYNEHGIKVDRASPFLYRATAVIALPQGEHRLLLRARTGSRLFVDGQKLLETRFPDLKADGHEEVPESPKAIAPDIRQLRPGHFESLASWTADGQPHTFVLEALIGVKGRRPELGELSVSVDTTHSGRFHLLAPAPAIPVPLNEDDFDRFAAERTQFWKRHDTAARRTVAAAEEQYWSRRHAWARTMLPAPAHGSAVSDIDGFIRVKMEKAGVAPAALVENHGFLRRLSLDVTGVIPTREEVEAFARDSRADKRARWIDRLLESGGWADHWVGYWQDVLAENPGMLKPMLNNTGPFRWWLHEAFTDNKPIDRFATELILMEGSLYYGGPAGFSMATDNDVPMAQKAQILGQAFLGMQMQCARCHDAPHHDFKQRDLFSIAAMLRRQPLEVPWSSSIPTNAHVNPGRKVKVTLPPGSKVPPSWPFDALITTNALNPEFVRHPSDSRELLAALVTDPRNPRFARVIANRLWKRYLGWGLVEPVDDWESAQPSHRELLDFLAAELVLHDYNLKHLARLILNSQAYQRSPRPDGSEDVPGSQRLFAAPARRRLSAEQLVDSLFVAAGKPLRSEELNMDIDGRRPVRDFNNLGTPTRAWQFTSLSNERDRPALSLPVAQSVIDVLSAFGWRESRQGPVSVRDEAPNVLQPATLANGTLGHGRITRLSDDSELTELCLAEQSVESLVSKLFLRVLSRPPDKSESEFFSNHLAPGFNDRRNPEHPFSAPSRRTLARAVSWANHLNPEATRLKQEQEKMARAGDLPTHRLHAAWRERFEDTLWALVNSPEFVFVP